MSPILHLTDKKFYQASYWIHCTPIEGDPGVKICYHTVEAPDGLKPYAVTLTKTWEHDEKPHWTKEVIINTQKGSLLYTEDDQEGVSWTWEEDQLDENENHLIKTHMQERFRIRYGS